MAIRHLCLVAVSVGERKFMERWVLLRKGADFEAIGKKYGITPRTAALIRNREVVGDVEISAYLKGDVEELPDARSMKGVEQAVKILRKKIENKKKIRVIGDYDIDGVNATYILQKGLSSLGAEVDSDIPDRMKDGYGLNMRLIERACEDRVDTVITCDNGIAAVEEIARGKELGLTVIVTDHHEIPYEETEAGKVHILPPADVIIDPKQDDCPYPFKELCGAAVAYKLVETLYKESGCATQDIKCLIENVAVATVGDVMDLVGENRIFVKEGLKRLKEAPCPGFRALIDCTGIKKDTIGAYHIGFILGPCLNAGGRLDTAKRALALLCADTRQEADMLAEGLKALNDERKVMTEQAVKQAVTQIEETGIKKDRVLVIYLPDCHESLAGIVAGRLRERYYRPVFILTDAKEGVKGSGRSIEAYSMYEEITKCRELFTKYGGHRLAAGISMRKENIEEFRRRLNESCTLTREDLTEKVVIDMELSFANVTERFIEELKLLEPFGKGNTKPVFAGRDITFTDVRIIGKNRNVLKACAKDKSGRRLDALYFGDVSRFQETLRERGNQMHITYYPAINEYMGSRTIQITITHYQ